MDLVNDRVESLGISATVREVAVHVDRGEDVVEVVRDSASELTYRLHFLGLTELLLEPVALAHVSADRLDADRLPILLDKTACDLDRDQVTVARDQVVLPDGLPGFAVKLFTEGVGELGVELVWDEINDRAPDQLFAGHS